MLTEIEELQFKILLLEEEIGLLKRVRHDADWALRNDEHPQCPARYKDWHKCRKSMDYDARCVMIEGHSGLHTNTGWASDGFDETECE